jgi:hypothetical protein
LSRKNRDLSASNHDIPDVGALVTVKIYLLANHTTEIVFANQIIEVLSAPA